MCVILGIQPDVPTEVNENGGRQAATPYAFHFLPPHAMFAAAEVPSTAQRNMGRRCLTGITRRFRRRNTLTMLSSICLPTSPGTRATTI